MSRFMIRNTIQDQFKISLFDPLSLRDTLSYTDLIAVKSAVLLAQKVCVTTSSGSIKLDFELWSEESFPPRYEEAR